MTNKLSLALAAALFALPTFVFAQDAAAPVVEETMAAEPAAEAAPIEEKTMAAEESESNLSYNLSLVSDYVFRGYSQNDFGPALQGGLDYKFGDSGFYVGGWASNVDFGRTAGANVELDLYVGYNTNFSDDWNGDVRLLRYNYLGTNDGINLDYNELIGAVSYKEMLTFTVGYANNYFGTKSDKQLYFGLAGSWDVGNGVNLTAGIGHTNYDVSTDYTDWTLGVNRDFGPVNIGLNYYDTNLSNKASDQVVLAFSIGG
jgi:uncharacterized protein (TIGR02001 family)